MKLGTGNVVRADAVKKLYRVTLCVSPYSELTAVPVGGLNAISGENGVVSCESYAIGDHVLFAYFPALADSPTEIAWIIGRVPRTTEYKEERKEQDRAHILPSTVSKLLTQNTSVDVNKTLQESIFLGDYSGIGNFPIDVSSGDYTVAGERTLLSVSDYGITLSADKAKIFFDSILGGIKQSSTLYDRYTLGESCRTQYYNGHIVHTRKLNCNPKDGITKGGESKFPYREQFSDLLYCYSQELLDNKGRPITNLAHNLDGSIVMRAANSIKIERTVRIPNRCLRKDDSLISTVEKEADLPKQTKDSPLNAVNNSDWTEKGLIDGSDDILTCLLDAASKTDWEAPIKNSNVKFKNNVIDADYEVADGKSGIDILPDGTVLIRDAWGSEIRMGHGNVQIAAANNLTTIAGRDQLAIVSGVSALSAGKGVEVGTAEGNIAICASKGDIKATANNNITTCATDYKEHVSGRKESNINISYAEYSIKEERVFSYANTVANSLQLSGQAQCIITSNACGINLVSNVISIAASYIVAHGNLAMNMAKYTIKNVVKLDNTTTNVVVPASAGRIYTSGDIFSEGSIVTKGLIWSNTALYTSGNVACVTIAAKNKYIAGVSGLNSQKFSLSDVCKKPLYEPTQAMHKELLGWWKKIFTQEEKDRLKHVFTKWSGAFKIIEPLFSRGGKTKNKVSPATCSAGSNKVSYIYPGERFWRFDGLVTMTKTDLKDIVDRESITIHGCDALKLNEPNDI